MNKFITNDSLSKQLGNDPMGKFRMRRRDRIEASAPGSLMLLGEHAVLHGRRALVAAVNKRITVVRSELKKPVLHIRSSLGEYEAALDTLPDHPAFRFVLDAVRFHRPERGIQLEIHSDFSRTVGLSSSAAVTVSVHAVFQQQDPEEGLNRETLFSESLQTIRRVQGTASGADAAAAVYGGVLAYRMDPLEQTPVPWKGELTAVYSGSKMKTAEVIRRVEAQRAVDPERYEQRFNQMDAYTGNVMKDPGCLGLMMEKNQILMEEMGLCNKSLERIIAMFRSAGVPAKISGSGLGDCAVGLGPFPEPDSFTTFPLRIDSQGVFVRTHAVHPVPPSSGAVP